MFALFVSPELLKTASISSRFPGSIRETAKIPGFPSEFGNQSGVAIVHFSQNKEILTAGFLRSIPDRWNKALPELVIDLLHRVQAESGDVEVFDPIRINIDHAMNHT